MPKFVTILYLFLCLTVACDERSGNPGSKDVEEIVFEPCISDKLDTLSTSSLALQNVDSALVDTAVARFSRLGNVHSLVIVKNGYIVSENYFNGFGASDTHYMASATKSVTSLVTGIAIDRGFIEDVDVRLDAAFPEFYDSVDVRKRAITLRHLLTMSSGLEWFEGSTSIYGNAMKWAIQQFPLVFEPGSKWRYSSADLHLVSGVFTKNTKQTLKEFGTKYLFNPLGIVSFNWWPDRFGYTTGSTLMELSPRSMAKLGLMVARDGCYGGKRIVSSDWIAKSTTGYLDTPVIYSRGGKYGFGWWINKFRNYKVVMAQGSGCQGIYVIKDLDLVVVFMANMSDNNFTTIQDIVASNIIVACDPNALPTKNK